MHADQPAAILHSPPQMPSSGMLDVLVVEQGAVLGLGLDRPRNSVALGLEALEDRLDDDVSPGDAIAGDIG